MPSSRGRALARSQAPWPRGTVSFVAIDPADLKRWGNRGARRSTSAAAPAPALQGIPPATFEGAPPLLPAPPAGYQYVLHQGVPMLAPISPSPQEPRQAAPFAPQQAFTPWSNV